MNKNLTMLPNYEAIAYDIPDEMRVHVAVDYKPIGRVIFLEEDAEFFVLLYFVASIFALASSCVCYGMVGIEYKMTEDAHANIAV